MFYNFGGQGSVTSELAADTIPESGILLPSSSESSELKIILTHLSHDVRKLVFRVPNQGTNQAVQPQKMTGGCKLEADRR